MTSSAGGEKTRRGRRKLFSRGKEGSGVGRRGSDRWQCQGLNEVEARGGRADGIPGDPEGKTKKVVMSEGQPYVGSKEIACRTCKPVREALDVAGVKEVHI